MFNPRRYLRNLVVFTILATLLDSMVQLFLSLQSPSLVLAFAPVWIAALLEGQKYAQTRRRLPDHQDVWRLSCLMAEIYLTASFIMALVIAMFHPPMRIMLLQTNLLALFIVFGTFTAIAFVVIRFGYGWGAKLELKQHTNNSG